MKNWKKNYFTILFGHGVSDITSSVLQFCIIWYVEDRTNSPLALSIAMLVGFLPRSLLGIFVGALIDRLDRKKVMIFSDLLIAGVSLVPLFIGIFFNDIPLPIIFIMLFCRSIGAAFYNPTLQAVTPQIIPPNKLVTYSAYAQAVDSIALLLSPVFAGAIFSFLSLSSIIFIDVIGAVIGVATLLLATIPKMNVKQEKLSIKSTIATTFEGFNVLRLQKGLLLMVVATSVYSLAMMPISALFPNITTSHFNKSTENTAFVEAIFAVGFLFGSISFRFVNFKKNRIILMIASCLIMSFSLLFTSFQSPEGFSYFVLSAFLMGYSGPFYWGTYRPVLQKSFTEEYLGRVLALANSITVIASPVGMVIAGLFSEKYGSPKWFFIASIMIFFIAIFYSFNKDVRKSVSILSQ